MSAWAPPAPAGTWVNPRFAALAAALVAPPKTVRETISSSSQIEFTQCATRYRYRKEEGLRSPHSGQAAEVGGLVHRFLATAYRLAYEFEVTLATPRALIASVVERVIALMHGEATEYVTSYDEQLRAQGAALGVKVGETLAIATEALNITVRTLRKYLAEDLLHRECIGVELPVSRALPGMRGVATHGILDLLLQDRRSGTLLIVDHKTTKDAPSTMVDRARFDPQRPGYVWAVEQAFPAAHVELVYNVIRKHDVGPPKLNQCASCKGTALDKLAAKAGRDIPCSACAGSGFGAFSRAKCDTTGDEYRKLALRYPHLDTSEIQPLVDELDARGDTFNARIAVTTTRTQIANWLQEAADVVRDRRAAQRTGRWTKNRGQCSGIYGLCVFRELCEEDTPEARRAFVPMARLQKGAPAAPETATETDDYSAPF